MSAIVNSRNSCRQRLLWLLALAELAGSYLMWSSASEIPYTSSQQSCGLEVAAGLDGRSLVGPYNTEVEAPIHGPNGRLRLRRRPEKPLFARS